MVWLFDAVVDRLKALFASDAAAHFESQFARRQSERRAELLRQAEQYDSEGLAGVADDLRRHAERLSDPALKSDSAKPPHAAIPGAPPRRLPSDKSRDGRSRSHAPAGERRRRN
ncbi:MAG TPA: hypothetical protein VGE52_06785 [Pirellulales bacterium]